MVKIKLLTFVAFAVLMLGAFCLSPALATDSTTFSLALSTNQIQYKIPAGTTFNGTVATSGMVRVWVTAPNADEIVNLGIVDKTTSFGFLAEQNGTYTFNFENDLPNTITVTFSYTSNPPLPNTNSGIPLAYIAIIGAIAVGGSLLIFFGIRHNTKKAIAAHKKKLTSEKQAVN